MNKKKIKTVTELGTTTHGGVTHGNVWVEEMFGGFPTKIQADPKFKALSVGAQNLATLISTYVPPGQGQADALNGLKSSFRSAANELANAIIVPASI